MYVWFFHQAALSSKVALPGFSIFQEKKARLATTASNGNSVYPFLGITVAGSRPAFAKAQIQK